MRVCFCLQPLVSRADGESLTAARDGELDVGCALIEVTIRLAQPFGDANADMPERVSITASV